MASSSFQRRRLRITNEVVEEHDGDACGLSGDAPSFKVAVADRCRLGGPHGAFPANPKRFVHERGSGPNAAHLPVGDGRNKSVMSHAIRSIFLMLDIERLWVKCGHAWGERRYQCNRVFPPSKTQHRVQDEYEVKSR